MKQENHHDVFVLPCNGDYVIYAPLLARVVHANAECVRQVRDFLRTGEASRVDRQLAESLGGLDWLRASHAPVPLPCDRHFHPVSVTLFPTNRCNLRCSYCFAEAGDFAPVEMPESISRAAIRLVHGNARRAGCPTNVNFHGGGEPTVAWQSLVEAMSYAKSLPPSCEGRPVTFGITTNGVLSAEHAEFVAREFQTVTLSFDGPEDVQNEQRPLAGGGGSYDAVMSFVEVLRKYGTRFGIRSTIMGGHVDRLPEIVDFFVDHTGASVLHFEPAFLAGRQRHRESGVPSPKAFAGSFLRAWERARQRGAVLRFSAVRMPETSLHFCGCSEDAFGVTPEGDVTACFEVCRAADPLARVFHYGRYEEREDGFHVDRERLEQLRTMHVGNRPLCEKCFAKWSCSGDCPARVRRCEDSPEARAARCEMIREIIAAILQKTCTRGLSRRDNHAET